MAIVFKGDPGLGQAITSLGETLGSTIEDISKKRREQKHGTILQSVFEELPEDFETKDLLIASGKAREQGVPADEINKFIDTATKFQKYKKNATRDPFEGQSAEEISQSLQDMYGMEKEQADADGVYLAKATKGERTAYTKDKLERAKRGEFGRENFDFLEPKVLERGEKYEFPTVKDLGTFSGLNKKEIGSRINFLDKENMPIWKENKQKVLDSKKVNFKIGQLINLNETKQLPEGLGRINLNPVTGELILPAAANAETQKYVAIVNSFQKHAKDDYGARVTNFELASFMARLPTLANTYEGRKLILDYMKNVNEIDSMYQNALQQVYDHYGTGKISPQDADREARNLLGGADDALIESINKLEERSQELEQFIQGALPGQGVVELDGELMYIDKDKLPAAKANKLKIYYEGE